MFQPLRPSHRVRTRTRCFRSVFGSRLFASGGVVSLTLVSVVCGCAEPDDFGSDVADVAERSAWYGRLARRAAACEQRAT